jgi:hypothetical protein
MPDLSDALAYANKGWRVIPVPPGQKYPVLTGWPSKATTDPDQIAQWWTACPNSNIAVLTGKKSGIAVLDIDGDPGDESLTKLFSEQGQLTNTYSETAPNGQHLFFIYPEGGLDSSIGVLPGIDLLSDKRCVIVAPSVVEGKCYAVSNDAVLAPFPDWLIAKLLEEKPIPAGAYELETTGQSLIPKGERNNRLFIYA